MALVAAEGGSQEKSLSFPAPAVSALEKDGARSYGVESEKRTESQPHIPKPHSHGRPTKTFKIIVIGDSNVGKTCLTFRFCNGRFPNKTEATIGVDFREKVILVNGEPIKVSHVTMSSYVLSRGLCPPSAEIIQSRLLLSRSKYNFK